MPFVFGTIATTLALGLLWGKDGDKNVVLVNSGEDDNILQNIYWVNHRYDYHPRGDDFGLLVLQRDTDYLIYVSDELSPQGHEKKLKLMWDSTYYYEYYNWKDQVESDRFFFKLIKKGDDTYMFESYAYPGEVIDVEASREEPGTPLIIYPRHDGPNQVFKGNNFQEVESAPSPKYNWDSPPEYI